MQALHRRELVLCEKQSLLHGRRLTLQPGGIASAIFMLLASIVLTSCPISHDTYVDSRVLHSHDGSWQLIIPPGAVAEPEKIAVRRLQAAAKGVTESGLERTPIYEFSPDGLVFNVPLLFQCQYDQKGLPEGGIEEKITSFYFINENSTLERAPIHLDLDSNVAEVKIARFSVGILLTWGITLVNEGYITTRFRVNLIAHAVIPYLYLLFDDEAAEEIALDITDMEGFTRMREFPIADGQFPFFPHNYTRRGV
jgi:hypothetical protein